jgi:hypothetical protein
MVVKNKAVKIIFDNVISKDSAENCQLSAQSWPHLFLSMVEFGYTYFLAAISTNKSRLSVMYA